MKNNKLIWFLALVLILCVAFVACDGNKPQEEPKEVTIQLNTSALDLDVYETSKLTANVENSDEAVVWTSSNDAVATVKDGLVTAVAEGEATIKASVGGKEATCVVTITNSHIAPVIKPERTEISIDVEGEYNLTVVTTWKSNPVEGLTYNWTLVEGEADDVASVTPNENGATIKGLKYGSTEYTVSTTTHGATLAQKIIIRVCNTDITFEAGNLENEDGEFKARVSLVETEKDTNALVPSLKVLEKNEVIDAKLEWTSSEPSIIAIEDGKFVAKSEGKAIVSTSYANNVFSVEVEAYRPEIELSDSVFIEMGRLQDIKLESEIKGTVNGVLIGENNVLSEVKADGSIALKKELLPSDSTLLGKTSIIVETELASYKVNAEIYTMIIRNADDLNAYFVDLKSQFDASWSADGYYILANDIDCGGATLMPNIAWGSYEKALENLGKGDDGLWLNGKTWGFKGIFDGQGHTIDNFTANIEVSGFVGTVLNQKGIVRNVSFTNVTHLGKSGLIAFGGNGTISNVYMSFKSMAPGLAFSATNIQYSTAFISQDTMGDLRIENCFVEYQPGAFGEDVSLITALTAVHLGYGSLNGVYAVGVPSSIPTIIQLSNEGSGDVYGAYATYADLLADADLSAYENDFWTLVNGIPYPKALVEAGKVPVASIPEVSLERDIYGRGSEIELTLGLFDKIVLSDSANELGCTVNGNKIKLAESIENGTKVEFSVVSVLDGTKKLDLSITIDNRETTAINIPDRQDVELNGDETHSKTVFDLDLVGIAESVIVKIAGTVIPNATIVDGDLVINSADVPASLWGEKDLEAYIVTDSHIYTVNVPVTVITKVIRNRADLRWYSVNIKKEALENKMLYGGYYVLGADIQFGDYDGSDESSWFHSDIGWSTFNDLMQTDENWTNGRLYGFNGVFDGRGHSITNMIMSIEASGLVGTVLNANGIVRNISFLDLTTWGRGGTIAYAGCGTVENVFITMKAMASGAKNDWSSPLLSNDSMGEYRVKNFIVIYKEGAIYKHNEAPVDSNAYYQVSALGHLHPACNCFNNVYAIGAPSEVPLIKRCGCCGDGSVYGGYATYADLIANADLSSFENGFWTLVNGAPYPKSLVASASVPVVSLERTIYGQGSEIELNLGFFDKIVLSDSANELGCIVDGNKIKLAESIENGTKVEFSVVSVLDETKKLDLSITIDNREAKTIDVSDRQDIELNGDEDHNKTVFDLNLLGTVEEDIIVKIAGTVIPNATIVDGDLVINSADVPASLWGEKDLEAYIVTNSHIYTVNVPVTVITKVIRNFADLRWYNKNLKKDCIEGKWLYGGYYVLGNDIVCDDIDGNNSETWFHNDINWDTWDKDIKGSGDWTNGRDYGFNGVFDGRGHSIINLNMNVYVNGLVGTVLNKNGIVRNISFLDLTQWGRGGTIAYAGCGTIENVFITMKSIAAGGGNDWSSPLLSNDSMGSYRVKNFIVIYKEGAFYTGYDKTSALGHLHPACNCFENVYAIGAPSEVPLINRCGCCGDGSVYGGYATYADLIANADLSSFENGFWTLVNGAPYPKSLVATASIPAVGVDRIVYGQGSEIELDLGLFDKIILSDSAKELGCTVEGNKIKLGASIENDTKIEFSVVSALDETKKVDLSITIENLEEVTINIPDRQDIELNGDDAHSKTVFEINLLETAKSVSVRIAGTVIPNALVVDGNLVINASDIPASLWGEKDLKAYIVTDSHIYTVNVPVTVITKVIRNREDLRWYSVNIKKEALANTMLYGGYYVLGADIQFGDYDGSDQTSWFHNDIDWGTYYNLMGTDADWMNGNVVGFNGVFDGRGYVIDNMTMDVRINGLVGTVLNKNGIVRNLSLTNVTIWGCGGGIAYAGCGTIENVYMTVKAMASGAKNDWSAPLLSNDSMGSYRVKNFIVIYKEGAFYTGYDKTSALGHLHPACNCFNNVYAIGAPSEVPIINRCGCCGDGSVYGGYADAAGFAEAVTVSAETGWDMNYWTVDANGVAIPRSLVKEAE